MSSFWIFVVPGVVVGAVYYAYNSPGWVAQRLQSAIGPLVEPLRRWFSHILASM